MRERERRCGYGLVGLADLGADKSGDILPEDFYLEADLVNASC